MNYHKLIETNNPVAFRIIKNAIKANKISHAYLFSATKNTTIFSEPIFLMNAILNHNHEGYNIENYPDFIFINGSKTLIKKELIINATLKLQQTALDERGLKFLFIQNIENANKYSLNSLLKFIEEPTNNTFIVMTTNNISQVISTIKSRSQIINLKIPSKKTIENMLIENKVPLNRSLLISSISESFEQGKIIFNSPNFEIIYSLVTRVLKNAIHANQIIFTGLSKKIYKKNYKLIFSLMREFFNDIWRLKQKIEVSFKDETGVLEEYISTNFDFVKAITIINKMLISESTNVNFELFKNKTLIEIRRCYG